MYFLLSWRNIWRNKRRTLITLASIIFAVFFACVLQSIQYGGYEAMISMAVRFSTGHIRIHAKGYWEEKSLDNSMAHDTAMEHRLEQIPDVQLAVPRIESFALASYNTRTRGTLVVGIDPRKEDTLTRLRSRVVAGTYPTASSREVMIGQGLAEFLHIGTGDTLILISQGYHGVNAAATYIVGSIVRLPSPDLNNQILYLPLAEAQNFYGAQNLVTSWSLIVNSEKNVRGAMQAAGEHLDAGTHEILDWRMMMPELVQTMEFDMRTNLVLLFILYAVVGFGIFGTFLMMTAERRYEFGIMIASGMNRRLLQIVTLIEIFMLAVGGILGGLLVSLPPILYFYANPIRIGGDLAKAYERFGMEPLMTFSMDPALFLQQVWVILAITILLGIYPMWHIHRLNVVKAIRR